MENTANILGNGVVADQTTGISKNLKGFGAVFGFAAVAALVSTALNSAYKPNPQVVQLQEEKVTLNRQLTIAKARATQYKREFDKAVIDNASLELERDAAVEACQKDLQESLTLRSSNGSFPATKDNNDGPTVITNGRHENEGPKTREPAPRRNYFTKFVF